MSWQYKLKGKTPVPVDDILEWAEWFETANRVVKQTELPTGERVSTVFLGLDSGFFSTAPLLFETMIFGGKHDGEIFRYATWEEAEAGHQAAIELVFQA